MSLLEFATDVHEVIPFTNKVAEIDHGLTQLHGDWATALYDAIVVASRPAEQKLRPSGARPRLRRG